MAEPVEMQFGLLARMGTWNHVFDAVQIPPWEVAILRGKGWPIVKYSDALP